VERVAAGRIRDREERYCLVGPPGREGGARERGERDG